MSTTRCYSNHTLERHAIQVFSPLAWRAYEQSGFPQTYVDLMDTAPDVAQRFVFGIFFGRAANPHVDMSYVGHQVFIADTGRLMQSRADMLELLAHVSKLSAMVPARLQSTALFGAACAMFASLLMPQPADDADELP
jgi:hypothetical protein